MILIGKLMRKMRKKKPRLLKKKLNSLSVRVLRLRLQKSAMKATLLDMKRMRIASFVTKRKESLTCLHTRKRPSELSLKRQRQKLQRKKQLLRQLWQ